MPGIARMVAAVLALVACAGVAALGLAAPQAAERGTALRPDLVARPPTGLRIDSSDGRRLLRLTATFANRGPGPLEVAPSNGVNHECTRKGRTPARQRIRIDANRNGRFDAPKDVRFRSRRAGCIRLHPTHEHWHLGAFAAYKLRRMRAGEPRRRVARSRKASFCLRDSALLAPGRPGAPPDPAYGECTQSSVQGISVGWADVYRADLPGQTIDIAGLRSGRYCLILVADPKDRLRERREHNNRRGERIRIRANTVSDLGRRC